MAIVVCALVAVACGSGGDAGTGGTGGGAASPGTTVLQEIPGATTGVSDRKSAARWETVVTLAGRGAPASPPAFEILPGAIQWRARWSCETGALKVETSPHPRRGGALVDATCPQTGEGFSIVTGAVTLAMRVTGPWTLVVDQQIDTPLNEPPLPAMATARVLSSGDFYNIEKSGQGTARIYQLPDGQRALRIENLIVNENTDLFVWLDDVAQPKTSQDAVSGQYWVLGNLKSTIGSQNYVIPRDVPVDRVRSIVIWCQPVAIAYAAAALTRG